MNRFKFRAWDKDDNKMIYNVFPAQNGDMAGMYNGRFCLRLPSERIILEQFTGLTDKNGKDIFEGDICRFKINGLEYISTIKYGAKKAGFHLKVKYWSNYKYVDKFYIVPSSKNIEVIRNIHENKELLK